MTSVVRPDPATEIRITTLHATRGMNYWSQRPVVRMDLAVGQYEHISSADVPGFTERLIAALPGLEEHHCSIGRRGGFVIRLGRGTYAPHIVEHVALELQTMIGHDVGYGRTRGGDVALEYTLVFEHRHEQVGLRAAALALDVVQRAFGGTLEPESVTPMVQELRALAETSDSPPVQQRVFCAITGGSGRAEARQELATRLNGSQPHPDPLIVDVAPAYLLQAGLPYARSELAIILDADISDVPPRYRDAERATRLVATLCDGVRSGGFVVCPASEWDVQNYAREQNCAVAVFAIDDELSRRDAKVAGAVARVRDGRILLESWGGAADAGPLKDDVPAAAQVAAALAAHVLSAERRSEPR